MTRAVTIAFLLPILVFVAFLGGFGWALKDVVARSYQTPLAAALAVPATVAFMLVLRVLTRLHQKK